MYANRLFFLYVLLSLLCLAQDPEQLLRDPAVKAALDAAKINEPQAIERQIHVCEIPAPPFHETERGLELKRLFVDLGLKNVRIDKAGNVIGTRPGLSPRPNLVFSAHLDTVFPEGTVVKVSREGHVLKGPGIGDDCRGLAVMLATIEALDQAKVQTPGTITFVADVGEEGLGDLRGVKNLFGESMPGQIDKFISVDGNGLDIVNIGVGSMRYRVTFKGPGGHSYGAFGMANSIQAMGRAIAKISDFKVPDHPKTTFNVGRVGGGTSVNAIPSEAWMEVDMRSADVSSLKALDAEFLAAVESAVEEENRRWNNRGKVSASPELVGIRPAGQTSEGAQIVQTALAVSRALGIVENLREGSTDANVPMNMNIPAITIGGGGSGSGVHTLNEAFDTTDSWRGTQRAVLLAIALAR
ncbi:MAG TPA: M20/M25/M40 family metallo-hydrolase [Bryobacteraceae bacterium]|nr:M20/M25/M40 family metallo-hydrolase [Bryobacteraceae bacterium]